MLLSKIVYNLSYFKLCNNYTYSQQFTYNRKNMPCFCVEGTNEIDLSNTFAVILMLFLQKSADFAKRVDIIK